MNADWLLAHYERIADAPEAVPRLRRFILDLAVRSKLVEQDPNDEPASELLRRMDVARLEMLEAGYPNLSEAQTQLKKLSTQTVPDYVENLPTGWSWATLQQCAMLVVDCKNKTAPYSPTGIRLIRTTNVKDGKLNASDQKYVNQETYEVWSARCKPETGDILITREAPMGEVCLIPPGETICLGQRIMLVRLVAGFIDRNFMLYSLRDPGLMDRVQDKPLGMTVQHLRVGGIETLLVAVPPLAEQHRIVAKVDELMALCDRLEAARTERETTRDRMAAASLVRLNDPDPDRVVFRNHAAFAIENLAPLTTRTDQIKSLRQTILNLAVRGKLVEQDPNDEPAAELVKRIAADKARLVKARKIKKTSLESPIFPNNTPFSLPTGWAWITLGWICSKTGSGSTPRGGKKAYKPSGVVFLRSQNVHDYGLRLSDAVYIDRATHERMSGTAIETSDLLLNITGGSIGRCCLVPDGLGEANISQHVAIIRTAINGPQHFMRCVVLSPYFQDFISNEQTGAGRGGLPKNKMDRIPVPLPPLAEQHRIVARVDELMVLCNRLESSLAAADTTRHHFLESLLQDVLEPAADQFATVRRI